MHKTRPAILVVFVTLLASSLGAATFVVPPDREMVKQATAIVIASALNSRTQLNDAGAIETVTTMSVEEVIKGDIQGSTFEVYEPGGVYGKRWTSIPGIPRFADGDRYVLFLMQYKDTWRVLNLILGKFTFATDILGHDVLVRDEKEINGWDSDGKLLKVQDQNRSAEPFLNFIRGSVGGGPARQNYRIPAEALFQTSASVPRKGLKPSILCVFPCTPTSYTYDNFMGVGPRWQTMPVSYYSSVGANAAALTAMNNAIASWNNDSGSAITLVNAGPDDGTHTTGAGGADGRSTVLFERDLTAYGAPNPISCTGGSWGGSLGVGGVTNVGGTHIGPNGETFDSATEGDVEMNRGTSTCAFFIGLGDFNSAVAHELGHTIGFRHSDENRTLGGGTMACATDATLECSTNAIMKAFIPSGLNGALQLWDQHATGTVYPNPAVAAPTGVEAHAISASTIRVTWTTNGAPTYHIYRSANNSTFTQVPGNPSAPPFDDTTAPANAAYVYVVRAFNVVESGNSNQDLASLVTFTNSVAPGAVVNALDFTELRNAVNKVQTLVGTANTAYTDPTLNNTVTVKKVHVDELLTRLNAARGTLGLGADALSAGAITAGVTPVRASDVTDLRAGTQ